MGPKNNNNFTKIVPKKSPKEKKKKKLNLVTSWEFKHSNNTLNKEMKFPKKKKKKSVSWSSQKMNSWQVFVYTVELSVKSHNKGAGQERPVSA